jgi:predicted DCC family thiol-disulfide oxidoreductase YuxK
LQYKAVVGFDFMRFLCAVIQGETSAISRRIVFFDGICNLCNFSVDFLMRHDKHHLLFFSPLQGKTAAEMKLPLTLNVDSFFYLRNNKLYAESTAAIRVLADLGFWWKWVYVFLVIPPFLRNPVYRWIARNRYRWFGKRSSCRFPTEEEKRHFLP